MKNTTIFQIRLIVIGIFILFAVISLHAQCTTQLGFVCISQASANKASELVDKYKAANEVIAALQAQVSTLQIAVKDRDELILRLKNLGAIDDQIHAKEVQLQAVMQSMLTLEADIIDRLRKELTGGKTKMQRFLDFLKTAYYVLAGGAIVAGL